MKDHYGGALLFPMATLEPFQENSICASFLTYRYSIGKKYQATPNNIH